MSQLLIKLNGVSAEECDAVRQLLDEHEVEYYETSEGNWGVSVAAIWLANEDQLPQAKVLLDQHHSQWAEQFNAEPVMGFWQNLRQQPLRVIGMLVFLGMIIYFSVAPFIGLI